MSDTIIVVTALDVTGCEIPIFAVANHDVLPIRLKAWQMANRDEIRWMRSTKEDMFIHSWKEVVLYNE